MCYIHTRHALHAWMLIGQCLQKSLQQSLQQSQAARLRSALPSRSALLVSIAPLHGLNAASGARFPRNIAGATADWAHLCKRLSDHQLVAMDDYDVDDIIASLFGDVHGAQSFQPQPPQQLRNRVLVQPHGLRHPAAWKPKPARAPPSLSASPSTASLVPQLPTPAANPFVPQSVRRGSISSRRVGADLHLELPASKFAQKPTAASAPATAAPVTAAPATAAPVDLASMPQPSRPSSAAENASSPMTQQRFSAPVPRLARGAYRPLYPSASPCPPPPPADQAHTALSLPQFNHTLECFLRSHYADASKLDEVKKCVNQSDAFPVAAGGILCKLIVWMGITIQPHQLYWFAVRHGGSEVCSRRRLWRTACIEMGMPEAELNKHSGPLINAVKKFYYVVLRPLEAFYHPVGAESKAPTPPAPAIPAVTAKLRPATPPLPQPVFPSSAIHRPYTPYQTYTSNYGQWDSRRLERLVITRFSCLPAHPPALPLHDIHLALTSSNLLYQRSTAINTLLSLLNADHSILFAFTPIIDQLLDIFEQLVQGLYPTGAALLGYVSSRQILATIHVQEYNLQPCPMPADLETALAIADILCIASHCQETAATIGKNERTIRCLSLALCLPPPTGAATANALLELRLSLLVTLSFLADAMSLATASMAEMQTIMAFLEDAVVQHTGSGAASGQPGTLALEALARLTMPYVNRRALRLLRLDSLVEALARIVVLSVLSHTWDQAMLTDLELMVVATDNIASILDPRRSAAEGGRAMMLQRDQPWIGAMLRLGLKVSMGHSRTSFLPLSLRTVHVLQLLKYADQARVIQQSELEISEFLLRGADLDPAFLDAMDVLLDANDRGVYGGAFDDD